MRRRLIQETVEVTESSDNFKESSNEEMGSKAVTETMENDETSLGAWNSRMSTPFVQKIWDMMDKEEIKPIVSWSSSGTSFVIWDHHLFAAKVLPIYFKKPNFQSFVCQLNAYGFRKISRDKWEFKNDNFRKGEKYLLNNMRRRKYNQVPENTQPAASETEPSADYMSSHSNMATELKTLTKEHHLQKLEIVKLKEMQENLEKELASLKKHTTEAQKDVMFAVQTILGEQNDIEVTKSVDEGEMSEEGMKGKRKFEEKSDASDSGKPTMCYDVESWCPVVDDGEEVGDDVEDTFASLFTESSEWVEYYIEMQERATSLKP